MDESLEGKNSKELVSKRKTHGRSKSTYDLLFIIRSDKEIFTPKYNNDRLRGQYDGYRQDNFPTLATET